MTKKNALTIAMNLINDALDATNEEDLTEYVQELRDAKNMIAEQIYTATRQEMYNEMRKKENARKRAEMLKDLLPVLREVLSHTQLGMTVKDIESDFAQKWTGAHMKPNQIQYILLHDMKEEIEVIKNGRNANTYRLRGE